MDFCWKLRVCSFLVDFFEISSIFFPKLISDTVARNWVTFWHTRCCWSCPKIYRKPKKRVSNVTCVAMFFAYLFIFVLYSLCERFCLKRTKIENTKTYIGGTLWEKITSLPPNLCTKVSLMVGLQHLFR